MAVSSQQVVSDLGSEELKQLRKQFNALLDLIDGAADLAAIQSALDAGGVKKIVSTLELPDQPKRP